MPAVGEKVRIVVTGGRDHADRRGIWRYLDALHEQVGIAEIAHGGAKGADTSVDIWAVTRHVKKTVFHPNWKAFGKSAGPKRNRWMLDEFKPDMVIAFRGGIGTADCVSAAKERGIRVVLVDI